MDARVEAEGAKGAARAYSLFIQKKLDVFRADVVKNWILDAIVGDENSENAGDATSDGVDDVLPFC